MKDRPRIGIAGGEMPKVSVAKLLEDVKGFTERSGKEILLMDADIICGRVHIESAVEHADRAFDRGSNVSASRTLEIMLYASGERQLASAIEKVGLKDTTERVAVVVPEERLLGEVFDGLNLARRDSVLDADIDKVRKFGVSEESIQSVSIERAVDLVLERVALVDILK